MSNQKQYCRYCRNASLIDDGVIHCYITRAVMLFDKATRANKCKSFQLNEIDVFNPEYTYKPKADKVIDKNIVQTTMFEGDIENE